MKPTDFSVHVTSFLTHYLAAQRNVSPNTIKAYRDVFTLLLRFCRDVQGIAPERLHLEEIDVPLVEAFLDYLERERLHPAHEINGLRPCMGSSDMFKRKNRPVCISVKKSSRSRSGNMLGQPSATFPKKSWLRSWRSQLSARQGVEEMRSCCAYFTTLERVFRSWSISPS